MDQVFVDMENKMKKSMDNLRKEFSSVRTGRASVALLDNIKVEYYGSQVPVTQVATVSVPEARVLEIKPWDKAVLAEIEKAVSKSTLGLTPMNDGKVIRLTMPQPTQETRIELVKVIKKMAEDGRIALRAIRRDAMESIKDKEKKKELSEDDAKRSQTHIQKINDDYMKKVDEVYGAKEKEIMEV